MNRLWLLVADLTGLARVLGFATAVRYALAVLKCAKAIRQRGNLQPADVAMGPGPYSIRLRTCPRFSIQGAPAISGVREMYARDCYLQGGVLRIRDGDVVVDLGANMGNFTNMALAHGRKVRVAAFEPNIGHVEKFEASVGLNPGFRERVTLQRTFVGHTTDARLLRLAARPAYGGAPWLDEEALIRVIGAERIDFLKCDIEGGEFGLFDPGARLLGMTRQLAMEIHPFAGKVEAMVRTIEAQGFAIRHRANARDGGCVVLAERNA